MKRKYLIVALVITLTACNPATNATPAAVSAIRTETPPASPIPMISTSTLASTATQETYPTFTPAPTSTALPTLRPGQSLRLTSLHMNDEQNGWGIDASEHIVHTTDGGQTWKDVTPRNGGYENSGFFALDANTAWATPYQWPCYTENCAPHPNNASVWHTSDGGNTWQEQHVCLQSQDCGVGFDVSPEYYYPVAIHFSDMQSGWLLVIVEHLMFQDRYRIYRTTDSGTHWSPVIDNLSGPWTMSATGLAFRDQQTGWMSTSEIGGATDPKAEWGINQSTDAGLTWDWIDFPAPNPLPAVFTHKTMWCGAYEVVLVPPEALGVTVRCEVYIEQSPSYDFYFHSMDGGKHWISWLKTGDVDFINSQVGWRSTFDNGAYDLEQTRDGGQSWAKLKAVRWNGDLDFVNEQTGWAIATDGDIVTLVNTTDGGKTWEEMKPVVTAP